MRTVSRKSKQFASPYGNLLISSFCMLLFLSNIVIAEKTVNTVETPFGYVAQTQTNNWYSKDITLHSPDGIERILFVEAILRGDFQANTKIYLEIEGQTCNEAYWTIPNQDVADYDIKFDCSNLASGMTSGTYTIRLKTDKVAQNIYANIKFVYYNNPEIELEDVFRNVKVDISVGSTYYIIGETATIFAKVTEEGQVVNDAFCDVLLFNPNQTQREGFQLNYVNNSRGVYANTTAVPNEVGVYIVDVDCFRPFVEAYQQHYFAGDGIPAYDLYFRNSTNDDATYIEISNVQVGEHHCFPDRFSVGFSDFENGEFQPYRFLHHIENISVWVSKDLSASKEYVIILQFYKETDKGEMTLGAVVNRTVLTDIPTEITFNAFYPSEPFDRYSLLEVAFCVEAIEEVGRDVYFNFNSSTEPSGFVIHTIDMNATVDFHVGGSAELNVKTVVANITIESLNISIDNSEVLEKIKSVNETVKNESIQIQINQQEIYNWLQDFNVTVNNWFNNVFTNDTAILESIANLNTTVMNKLYLIQDDIASVDSAITSARVAILNQMIVNYNNLVSILNNLPTNILGSFEQQTPNWFKCIAQRLTGVYPAGSEC